MYKWTPFEIQKLYVDDLDYKGLYFWYEDAKDYIKQIENSFTL